MTDSFVSWLRELRPSARQEAGCIVFESLPLFVLLGDGIDPDAIVEFFEDLEQEEGLDPADDDQTARVEAAILQAARAARYTELLSITWDDFERFGPAETVLVLVRCRARAILCYHDIDLVPSFEAFALGPEDSLLDLLKTSPENAVPPLGGQETKLIRVRLFSPDLLDADDLGRVVAAMTGCSTVHHR